MIQKIKLKAYIRNFFHVHGIHLFLTLIMCIFVLNIVLFAQSVRLSWTPTKHPILSHYSIYRSIHAESSFVLLDTVTFRDSLYTDQNVQYNSQYFYVATSVDLIGNESGLSNIVDTTITIPVPVELSSFYVKVYENDAILEWSTKTESNNYGFQIQRREAHDKSYQEIAFIKGRGTTSIPGEYSYTDKDLTTGEYYYRLQQTDFNGAFECSHWIKITIGIPTTFHLAQNYPNPFNPSTTISYNLPRCGNVELSIYNMYGQIIYTLVDEFQKAGRYSVRWHGIDNSDNKVAAGLYYYRIETQNFAIFRKMLLIK